jgi:chitinase
MSSIITHLTNRQLGDLNVDTILPVDGTQGCLQAFSLLKQRNSHLKLILSVGGATGGANFAAVAADPTKRLTCANTARSLIDQYRFDGIDSMSHFRFLSLSLAKLITSS